MTRNAPRDLRRDARAILEVAVAAVEPEALVAEELARRPLPASRRVHLAAIGKAAAAMARGAARALDERHAGGVSSTGVLAGGVLVLPPDLAREAPAGFEAFGGGHPVPNAEGVRGAAAVLELAEGLGEDDLLLVLISGGGSALATSPPAGVPLEDVQEATRLLLRAGASIGEINAVRKHLDRLKGGRLARAAMPAKVVALVLSDVIDDPLDVIASGPVSPDPTTYGEVESLIRGFELWDRLPETVRRHLESGLAGDAEESPDASHPCFEGVDARIVGNNRKAAAAALGEARRLGYRTLLLTTSLDGEAREAGRVLASIGREIRRTGQPLEAPACVLAAGETTVTVTGDGRGGRNQELTLGAAFGLEGEDDVLVAGFGTDGIDGPTDAAGAFAVGDTLARARAAGLDPLDCLRRNDAYRLFEATDDLIITGATGTNVMDLSLILVRSGSELDTGYAHL